MTLVSTVTVGSGGAASIEFTGIAGTGKDLLLLISARTTHAAVLTNSTFTINADTGSNYAVRRLRGSGSAVTNLGTTTSAMPGGGITGANATASTFGNIAIYVSNYASSAAKSFSIDAVTENNATEAYQELIAGGYTQTSAITSLKWETQDNLLAQHTTASLYIISQIGQIP